MKKLLVILSLLLIPSIVNAQVLWEGWQDAIAFWLGVPKEIVEWPTVFWVLLLPFISTVAIIIGVFEEIGILRRATHKGTIYFIIALGWAALLIPTGFLATIAVFLYTIGAAWAIIIFMILFFVGGGLLLRTRLWGKGREAWATEMGLTREKYEKIHNLRRDMATLAEEARRAYDELTAELAKGARTNPARVAELRTKYEQKKEAFEKARASYDELWTAPT